MVFDALGLLPSFFALSNSTLKYKFQSESSVTAFIKSFVTLTELFEFCPDTVA